LPSIPTSESYATWQRIEMPDPTPHVYGGELAADVIAYKGGYVAVGGINGGCCDGGFTTDTRAVVWSSPDGKVWRLAPNVADFALSGMAGAATDGSRIVVVGFRNTESTAYPGSAEPHRAVWTSADGASWRGQFENVPRFSSVMFSDDRFWATANSDAGPEIWSTPDGLSWKLEAGPPILGPGTASAIRITPAGLVTFGSAEAPPAADGSYTSDAVTWINDGKAGWRRAPDQAALRQTRIADVSSLDGHLFAVGTNDLAGGGLAWESDDGLTWARLDDPAFAIDCAIPDRLIATPNGLVAVGAKGCGEAEFRAWTSPDGSSWAIVSDSQPGLQGGELQVQGWLVRSDGSLLAVGYGSVSQVFHIAPMAWVVEP
jgi:hypothetical protein